MTENSQLGPTSFLFLFVASLRQIPPIPPEHIGTWPIRSQARQIPNFNFDPVILTQTRYTASWCVVCYQRTAREPTHSSHTDPINTVMPYNSKHCLQTITQPSGHNACLPITSDTPAQPSIIQHHIHHNLCIRLPS
jgi:hypothetical protein